MKAENSEISMIGNGVLKTAQIELDVASGKLTEILGRYLAGIGQKLKQALEAELATSPSGDRFESWLKTQWLPVAAKLIWKFRTQCGQGAFDAGEQSDWFSAERFLGFLLVDKIFAGHASKPFHLGPCGIAELPDGLATCISNYLKKLTVREFILNKAHLSSRENGADPHDERRHFFSAQGWIDDLLIGWIGSPCVCAKSCKFGKTTSASAGSVGKCRSLELGSEHLRNLVESHRIWRSQGMTGSNPLDELRGDAESTTMFDIATHCQRIRSS